MNSWHKVLFYHNEKEHKKNISFQLQALANMTSAKKKLRKKSPSPLSDLNTLVLHGASLFFVASLTALLDNVESLVWYL